MYQATNILDEINFDILEYGYLTVKTHHASSCFDLWIPKLAAPLPFGNKNTWVEGVGDPFENSANCKITHAKTLPFQNFLTVCRHADTDFSSRQDINGNIHPGQGFVVTLMNHDPRDLKILKIM